MTNNLNRGVVVNRDAVRHGLSVSLVIKVLLYTSQKCVTILPHNGLSYFF